MQSGINFLDLPVYRHKDLILSSLRDNQVIIVESPTGSGKTTQLPLILKEAGYDRNGVIGVTQPRRIAALSICDFIKKQLNIEDNYCAYTMRFADTSDDTTRIRIITDGILLQELKGDRYLSRYSVMMVDESHERSLNIDFILGLLKQVLAVRNDLKVIISSATINTKKFSDFFDGAEIISIPTKVYPVTLHYIEDKFPSYGERISETDERLERIYAITESRIRDKKEGDLLIFLPGEFEINQCQDMLSHSPFRDSLQIYPLYGRLSKEEQERVFTPTAEGKIKVVISTNIAETSITIDGIKAVIDSGVAKVNYYDQKTFTSALISQPVSKASAEQRKGRAGRTAPGECYRLYTEESFSRRPDFSKEEITRCDLAEVALRMSDLAIYDYENFPFITAPKKSALKSAEYLLKLLDAIDEEHHLTATGQMMVRFPLIPRLSRAIVQSIMYYPDVLSEVLVAVSFLSTKGPFLFPKDKAMLARARQEKFQDSVYGDFAGYLKLYEAYTRLIEEQPNAKSAEKACEKFCKYYFLDLQTMNEIVHIKKQLEEIISISMGVPVTGGGEISHYLICLASGLIQFVCTLDDYSSYRSLTADEIYIHPSCSWFRNKPQYILAGEVVMTSRMFARSVSPLKAEWLDAIYPDLKKLLRYSRASGYENIQYSYQKGLESEEKKKSRDSEKKKTDSGYMLYGCHLKLAKSSKKGKKGNEVYNLSLKDLKDIAAKAFAAGSVPKIRVILTTKHGVTVQSLPLKTYIQEAALITDRPVLERFSEETYTIEDGHEALAQALENLFCPTGLGGGKAGFVSIMKVKGKKNTYRMYPSSSLPSCVDNAYSVLSEIAQLTKKSRRYAALNEACRKILDRLNELEGLE